MRTTIETSCLLCALLPAGLLTDISAAQETQELLLVAHRGGVVDEEHIENSLAGLAAAIERGYWMVEVDIRESKDGHLVVHHDANFKRYYGDPRQVADMNWDAIRRLRSAPGNVHPLEFDAFAAACRGRIRVMLDVKPPEHSTAFFESLERSLKRNDLLADAFVIGTLQSKAFFKGKARVGLNHRELAAAQARGEDVAALYFLFEHGNFLDAAMIAKARAAGVPIVPSVNTFHYLGDPVERGSADIERLRNLGVTIFQIDSVYDRALLSN